MATNQGSAGIRFELVDNSGFSSTVQTFPVVGVVGHSTKGAFNQLIGITSEAQGNQLLGAGGFNIGKYNYGLLAVKGAVLGGGAADFVRLYNPETNSVLKTDAWTYLYHTGTGTYTPQDASQWPIQYDYATNGVTPALPLSGYVDGFAKFGLRNINPITLVANSGQSRTFDLDGGVDVNGVLPLFSILPIDPTQVEVGDGISVGTALTASIYQSLSIKPNVYTSGSVNWGTYVYDTINNYTASQTSTLQFGKYHIAFVTESSSSADISLATTNASVSGAVPVVIQITVSNFTNLKAGAADGIKAFKSAFINAISNLGMYPILTGTTSVIDSTSSQVWVVRYSGDMLDVLDTTLVNKGGTTVQPNLLDYGTGSVINLAITTVGGNHYYDHASDSTVAGVAINGLWLLLPSDIAIALDGQPIDTVTNYIIQRMKNEYNGMFSQAVANIAQITYSSVLNTVTANKSLHTENVLVDNTLGSTFLSLGLADKIAFPNNFGAPTYAYVLNDQGKSIADVYINLSVTLGGVTSNYSGTIIPVAAGTKNLYIADAINSNSFVFIHNMSDVYEDLAQTGEIKLSKVAPDSNYISSISQYRWKYNPKDHTSSAGIQAAWSLFLDKDATAVDVMCSAGTTVQNINSKYEVVDQAVISSMLNVCAKRMDCYAILDNIALSSVDDTILKSHGINGFGASLAKWGAIYDNRDLMNDVYYTYLTQELPKSIGVVYTIVSNSASGMWWLPPAGQANGTVSGIFAGKGQKYARSYNYADDVNSDIAKLTTANINATRVTKQGAVYYGEATLMQENSVFQRLHATMLIAGMNRRFETLFEPDIFKLNDRQLRTNTQVSAQKILDFMLNAPQPGITSGRAICDTSNNTVDTQNNRQLILDIKDLSITETAEKWTIRTTVIQSGIDGTVTSSVSLIKQ